MEKGFRRLLSTAVAGTVAGAMLAAPTAYADQDRPPVVGAVQVCVQAPSGGVTGSIPYIVQGARDRLISVEVGTCSAAVPVIVDVVSVYQIQRQGVSARVRISVAPPERLIEDETPRRYVDVSPGSLREPTVVTFSVFAAGR
jgi:hypothetical protein